ncbi:uncharacterized protein BX663DRAFT_487175 [Cokeromyces recurvatus]|uniref:uncharacterized protein n=1 Tax=Cokeromyces recurvatus TaxID=90255 RepID=UPI0022205A29|nr:uncharacterized protein BX663DRAFT_487175 [Cokeromyces recurvatus]KAI7901896.1 hypothetical protein BX663DRAFT_487175 [Cokeromyces recurvatus]
MIIKHDQISSSSESTNEYRVDITKEYILDVMRVLLVLKDPEDNEKDEMNEFGDSCTSKQLAKWVANDGNWGQLERQQVDGARLRGRRMYLLRSQYRATVIDNVKNINSYRAFAHVDA